ncbi:Aste57867_13804 [Aphanomyces stellatus]|uniref:Aste57867_13804 protein n=1 Tax=Aphanomyces stellatus TaxID=120398 RepID=A0A485L0S0_9STRA|nr:hypothetical protein As57867_013754 [Aphanomyces stellatus]VFT90636.1 Aste57867_13804 [Aphanomyces stellatus]
MPLPDATAIASFGDEAVHDVKAEGPPPSSPQVHRDVALHSARRHLKGSLNISRGRVIDVERLTPIGCIFNAKRANRRMNFVVRRLACGTRLQHRHLPPTNPMSSIASSSSTSSTSWTERITHSIQVSRQIRGGNYVQLATVDADGRPHCRTVVFRGFLDLPDGSRAMKMITDARSDKVAQIHHSPASELVWWFSLTSEQYRVAGSLTLVSSTQPPTSTSRSTHLLQEARDAQWSALSDAAREQFFWLTPGLYDPTAAAQVPARDGAKEGGIGPPPDTFLLMLLVPTHVKYLRLTDNFVQDETRNLADNTWHVLPRPHSSDSKM